MRERRRAGARRAETTSRVPSWQKLRRSGGVRVERPRRRAHGLPGTLGLTLLGGLIPGSGYLYAGRRALGAIVIVGWLSIMGVLIYNVRDTSAIIDFVYDPTRLKTVAIVLGLGLLTWGFIVWTSYRLVRPKRRTRTHTILGNLAVGALCLLVATPVAQAVRIATVQADAVKTVFTHNEGATTPDDVSKENPWGGRNRVNVLLLGGDGGQGRTGVRTDSVILLSMNVRSGKTIMFSLPRNMMNAQFPEDSPLHELYPEGYNGYDDPAFYMLNAIYGQVPQNHPEVLGKSDNEGADAIKQAVSGSLGIAVDYYVLANLDGFKKMVDALGGITVNINKPVAIQGDTDRGIPPIGYLDPGPKQHLDGYHALWFARGRWGSDDYERMDRQRCAIDAMIKAADPLTLLRKYTDIAAATKDIIFTDIPLAIAPAFTKLALKVKDEKPKSVVFRTSDKFNSGDPDFEWMQSVVDRAIDPPEKTEPELNKRGKVKGSGKNNDKSDEEPDTSEDDPDGIDGTEDESVVADDVCGYHPTTETSASD